MSLKDDIAMVLNRHSAENESGTPDFILAQFLVGCLAAFDDAVRRRETWYGRDSDLTWVPGGYPLAPPAQNLTKETR